MSRRADVDALLDSFSGLIRSLGLLRPDTTPCGQPMSVTEAHAIGELHRAGAVTQQHLAGALRLQKSTVSRLVDQFEADGVVTREPNLDDRRSVLVSLTDLGMKRAEQLDDARRTLFARLLDELEPAERSTVVAAITRLKTAADALS
jgi:DNA-binding MarR family transcriptional regulator